MNSRRGDRRRTILAFDGCPLGARVHEAAAPRGVVVICPALGVRSSLYRPLAGYLSASGYTTVCFDYRGVGASKNAPVRMLNGMKDWLGTDVGSVVQWARRKFPDLPVIGLGHSMGGSAFGWSVPAADLDALVLIASQTGHYRDYAGSVRWRILVNTGFLIPAAAPFVGYLPSWICGGGEPIPKRMAREWAKWCRHPDYLKGYPNEGVYYGRYRGPLLSLSFSDDPMATRKAADNMARYYSGAVLDRLHLSPEEVGMERIGHWGFFQTGAKPDLWPFLLRWLDGRVNFGHAMKRRWASPTS